MKCKQLDDSNPRPVKASRQDDAAPMRTQGFLNLPAEIRNLIYDFVVEEKVRDIKYLVYDPYKQLASNHPVFVSCGSRPWLALSQTCKQLRAEVGPLCPGIVTVVVSLQFLNLFLHDFVFAGLKVRTVYVHEFFDPFHVQSFRAFYEEFFDAFNEDFFDALQMSLDEGFLEALHEKYSHGDYYDRGALDWEFDLRPLIVAKAMGVTLHVPHWLREVCTFWSVWKRLLVSGHVIDISFSKKFRPGPDRSRIRYRRRLRYNYLVTFTLSDDFGAEWDIHGFQVLEKRYPELFFLANKYSVFKSGAWDVGERRKVPAQCMRRIAWLKHMDVDGLDWDRQ